LYANKQTSKQANKQTMEYKDEELRLFELMKKDLANHKRRTVRMKYYPHNMDEWEAEHKVIEKNYRELIQVIRKERLAKEHEQAVKDTAEALLMLKKSTEKKAVAKKKRQEKKDAAKNVVPRKSSRIANKKK
jgi:agmatine/peptidylarginine deiminase